MQIKMPTATPPARDTTALWSHFSDTYFSLRLGLAVLAFAFPLSLYVWGKLRHGLDLQPSMSAYFWAATAEHCAEFPMRTIFVGFLFAIGVGLYLYKGLTTLENWALNAAGLCAAFVATFPEKIGKDEGLTNPRIRELFESCPAVEKWATQPSLPIHWIAAVTLFILLAYVAWACACKSLDYLPPTVDAAKYRRLYRSISIGMILFPIPGLVVAWMLGLWSHKVFFIEAAGVFTFGVYWAVKTRELALSGLERNPAEAVRNAVHRHPQPVAADAVEPAKPVP